MNRTNKKLKNQVKNDARRLIRAGEHAIPTTIGFFAHRDKETGVLAFYSRSLLYRLDTTAAMIVGMPATETKALRLAVVKGARNIRLMHKLGSRFPA